MKKSTILIGTLTSAMLVTCAACTPQQDKAALKRDYVKEGLITKKGNKFILTEAIVNHALSIAPKEEEFIPPCSTLTAHPNATRVVKLRINNKFDVKQTKRNVTSMKTGGGGDKTVPEPDPHPNPTTYDLKLDKTVWDNYGQIIAVQVILKDKEMRFLDDDHSVSTVVSDSPTTTMFTCLDPINYETDDPNDPQSENGPNDKDKYDSVMFYVQESNRRSQKFNIRLVVFQKQYPYVMPIIIDPVIDNNGFN